MLGWGQGTGPIAIRIEKVITTSQQQKITTYKDLIQPPTPQHHSGSGENSPLRNVGMKHGQNPGYSTTWVIKLKEYKRSLFY